MVEDLISRKAAVEAIEETDWYHINKDGVLVRGANSAEDLPLFIAEDVFEALRVVAPAKQQWIPVTERLPDIGDRCLCNVKSFAFPGSFYHAILPYDKYGFVEGGIYTDDVTHWMPLPEPPKEDDHE